MLGLLEQMPDDDTEGARLAYRMEGKGLFGGFWIGCACKPFQQVMGAQLFM